MFTREEHLNTVISYLFLPVFVLRRPPHQLLLQVCCVTIPVQLLLIYCETKGGVHPNLTYAPAV
jgi:hypothetical protein